jgi:hypothetical protein
MSTFVYDVYDVYGVYPSCRNNVVFMWSFNEQECGIKRRQRPKAPKPS